MIKEFSVRTSRRNELLDITPEIRSIIEESGVEEGCCHIFVPHTTAAVTINEKADPNVPRDISNSMEKIVPANWGYTHAEGNSDSHIKSSMVGASELVLIRGGKPVLGTWQAVFFCEFDGPRSRKCMARVSE